MTTWVNINLNIYYNPRKYLTIDFEIILDGDPNGMFQDENIMGHPPLF
jgi:hypothetical protein